MADMAHIAGLVAAGEHPSPVPHSDFVTTTTHKTLSGPRGGMILCREAFAKELDRALFPGVQGGPLMHIIAAKAVCFERRSRRRSHYQQQIVKNAAHLASALARAGFRLVSGGTDNHLMLVDVFSRGVTGKARRNRARQAAITVNKNAIPFDKNPPMVASGVRVGTPAVTTRGLRETEMEMIASSSRASSPRPTTTRSRGPCAQTSKPCAGSSRSTQRSDTSRARRSRVRGRRSARVVFRGLRDAPWTAATRGRGLARLRGRRRARGRSGYGHGQDTRLPRAGGALRPARARLDRHANAPDQIFYKDLPTVARALGRDIRAAYMKGRSNYLCLHRFARASEAEAGIDPADRAWLTRIAEWAAVTETGDRSEIEDLPDDLPFWTELTATSEQCLGRDCPEHAQCFVTRMRDKAAKSDIIIVNHHLLCADASIRHGNFGEVIPECDLAVIDEAHQFEDVVTQYFGLSLGTHRIDEFVRDVTRALATVRADQGGFAVAVMLAASDVQHAARRLFDNARLKPPTAATVMTGSCSRPMWPSASRTRA